ncbi:MAG: hypothetical protein KGJ86_00205 [Chloroflexota bacterium]|nr:hypothetical protein [Chloroflexota bacterium]
MSRLRIGLDLDGVVYDFDSAFRRMVRLVYAIELPVATSWNSHKEVLLQKGREDVWDFMWNAGVEEGLFYRGLAYPGAIEASTYLATVGKLVAITSRPTNARYDTFRWLSENRVPTDEVHIVHEEPKSSIPCDLYIDDGPHNAADLLVNTDAMVLLWDRPWNRDSRPGWPSAGRRFRRISSWEEVFSALR